MSLMLTDSGYGVAGLAGVAARGAARGRARTLAVLFAAAATMVGFADDAMAQLRVVTWNISNYSGGRTADIQNAVYGVFSGRSMSPDIILAQEFSSSTALASFVSALNTAPGSPGDWASAPFINGADTEGVMVYRTSKVQFVQVRTVAVGSSATTNQPRNTYRYDIRPVGYAAVPAASLALYNTHMKAGEQSADNNGARRLIEAQRVRDNAEGLDTNPSDGVADGLPAGWNFLIGGDFNIGSSSEGAYQELVASQANNTGRFFDPINTPGSWNNSNSFRFVHTQDPAGGGGMDDRYDQILISSSLRDGAGFDYIGSSTLAYSTSTWNDANHSYRCWGNDGSSFNAALNVTTNSMVGSTIAQALVNASVGSGHLPVYLDLRVPAKALASATTINFGQVPVGSSATFNITVSNSGNTALWTANGIANLSYSLAASSGFTAPGGSFIDAAGGTTNTHTITMNTATTGLKSGTLTITTNAPEAPTIVVTLTGEVVPNAPANLPPIADAGADTVVTDLDDSFNELVSLIGSASSDPDGTIVNYLWRRGPVTISNGPSANTGALLPTGSSTLTLTVTDDDGATAVDTVVVRVNRRPVANAGADATVNDADGNGEESVAVDASGSSDPDGTIAAYRWQVGPTLLAEVATPTTSITLPDGVNVVTLTVIDNDGATRTDTVTIRVNAGPTAEAGADQTVTDADLSGDEPVTLDGSSSSDDVAVTGYRWLLGPTLLSDTASPTALVTLPVGVNVVTLEARDVEGLVGTDTVTITVEAGQTPCIGDFDQDGGVTGADVEAFFLAFESGDSSADTDGDGGITGADVEAFFVAFESGC